MENVKGDLHIANEVLLDLAGDAVTRCYGVVGMCAPTAVDGIVKILPASRLRRGIQVATTEEGVLVDLYVIIEYGTNINTVSQNVVEAVSFALKEYVQLPIAGINVHVEGVKVRR